MSTNSSKTTNESLNDLDNIKQIRPIKINAKRKYLYDTMNIILEPDCTWLDSPTIKQIKYKSEQIIRTQNEF